MSDIFYVYGLPEHIVSDEICNLQESNGFRHTWTEPYHPATNGPPEHFVQALKERLNASLSSGGSLSQRLGYFLLMYRSSVHSTTGVTPSSMFMRKELEIQFDHLWPNREVHMAHQQSQQKTDHDWHSSVQQFSVGDLVKAKKFHDGPNWILPRITVLPVGNDGQTTLTMTCRPCKG